MDNSTVEVPAFGAGGSTLESAVGGNKIEFNTEIPQQRTRVVFGIELHAGVNFGGFVAGTINQKNAHNLTLTEEFNGILVKGPKCNKLVPWAALKGVDFLSDDGSEPVTGKSRV